MGFVKELGELLKELKPWGTVYEYQQGLMYRFGWVIEKRIKLSPKEKQEEKEWTGGFFGGFLPFRKKLPEGWKRRFGYFGAA